MHWKIRSRLCAGAILAGAFVLANPALFAAGTAQGSTASTRRADEGAIRSAEASARQHLNRFLEYALDEDGKAMDGASVRMAVARSGAIEKIWVSSFASSGGDRFIGRVSSAPKDVRSLRIGDTIGFSQRDILDWSLVGADGKISGNYTIRALLPQIAPGRAAAIAATLSDTPVPEDWRESR